MTIDNRSSVLEELRQIPGVGKSIAVDFWDLGLRGVSDLRGADPEALYEWLCALRGRPIDRCMLYVMRCAVYYAEQPDPAPALLQWWSWKDGGLAFQTGRAADAPPASRYHRRGRRSNPASVT